MSLLHGLARLPESPGRHLRRRSVQKKQSCPSTRSSLVRVVSGLVPALVKSCPGVYRPIVPWRPCCFGPEDCPPQDCSAYLLVPEFIKDFVGLARLPESPGRHLRRRSVLPQICISVLRYTHPSSYIQIYTSVFRYIHISCVGGPSVLRCLSG